MSFPSSQLRFCQFSNLFDTVRPHFFQGTWPPLLVDVAIWAVLATPSWTASHSSRSSPSSASGQAWRARVASWTARWHPRWHPRPSAMPSVMPSVMPAAWKDMKRYEKIWKVEGTALRAMEGYGRLWKAMEGYGRLWKAMEGYGRLWKAMEGYGRLQYGSVEAWTS